MSPLSDEQLTTIHELQEEVRDLHLEADEEWAKYLQTGDQECFDTVMSLDSEAAMKGLIAYIPKAGERKIDKVRKVLGRLRGRGIDLDTSESRVGALESVNEWRKEYGLPPLERIPMGSIGNSHECPMAMAFRNSLVEMGATIIRVGVGEQADVVWQDSAGVRHESRVNGAIGSFVGNFDDGRFVDLVSDYDLFTLAARRLEDPKHAEVAAEGIAWSGTTFKKILRALAEVDAELQRREQGYTYQETPFGMPELRLGVDSNREELIAANMSK